MIPERSSKLSQGDLRYDSIHTLRYHPGTKTKFHWPLFLISSHIGLRVGTQTTDTIQVKLDELLDLPRTMLSSEALKGESLISQQTRRMSCTKRTSWALSQPITDIATHCLADKLVGHPQRIPHRYTPLASRHRLATTGVLSLAST